MQSDIENENIKEKSRQMSIPEWHELAGAGVDIIMRIPINGNSMYPLIRRNRDMVTIVPIKTCPAVGDIIMFADPHKDRYVLHRVWKIENEQIMTWGDNCEKPDGWMQLPDIWGKAVKIERGNRMIIPNPRRGIRWAGFWHLAGKLYRRLYSYVYRAVSRIRKIKR